MKKILLAGFTLGLLFTSCQSAEEKAAEKAKQDSIANVQAHSQMKKKVDSAEAVMGKDKNYNPANAMGMLKTYNDYITKYPNDSMTAEYLFRAADLSIGSKQYTQGVNYLETILDKHKDYRNYKTAIWVAAIVYDTYLEDVNHGGDRARQLYQFLIDKYPGDTYAEQSKVLINYIGQPDSVMINDVLEKGGR